MRGADREQEERNGEHIAQNHHRQVQGVVVAHQDAVEREQNGGVRRDGESELAARAGDHQTLHRLVFLQNLNILGELDLLLILAADAVVFRTILFRDADNRQRGQQNRNRDADRGDDAVKLGVGVAGGDEHACLILDVKACLDQRNHELHDAHAQQGADGVEDGEQRTLARVVGQNGLTGSGAARLERVAKHPDEVDQREADIPQSHHRLGNQREQAVEDDDADCHDCAAQNHERAEFTNFGAGAVHHRADDRVGHGVGDTHDGDHDGGEHTQLQDARTELSDIGEDENEVNVGCAVVEREQHELIRLCAIHAVMARRGCGFGHG